MLAAVVQLKYLKDREQLMIWRFITASFTEAV